MKRKVTAVEAKDDGIYVSMEGKACNDTKRYDAVLVAIGRTPNGKLIDAGKAGVEVDERGFIHVDKQCALMCLISLQSVISLANQC